ncbi:hypothetical protein JAAARDRAFT_29719 [Jaapia argillacea MUCL 33604]|uniref:Uncharacterized protein n=1 Tax=Jaapia argillacea MUCL 33604 TaxID=933084 RepID=A0A067Q9Q8_9AGAM|nr:hypothetical protein JAAARDRAFT_29719 [Jaapia argillacea MUCL 33604]
MLVLQEVIKSVMPLATLSAKPRIEAKLRRSTNVPRLRSLIPSGSMDHLDEKIWIPPR